MLSRFTRGQTCLDVWLLHIRWSLVGRGRTVCCCYRVCLFFWLKWLFYISANLCNRLKIPVNKSRCRFTATSLHVFSPKREKAPPSPPCTYLRIFVVSNAGQMNIWQLDFFWMRSFWSEVSFLPLQTFTCCPQNLAMTFQIKLSVSQSLVYLLNFLF